MNEGGFPSAARNEPLPYAGTLGAEPTPMEAAPSLKGWPGGSVGRRRQVEGWTLAGLPGSVSRNKERAMPSDSHVESLSRLLGQAAELGELRERLERLEAEAMALLNRLRVERDRAEALHAAAAAHVREAKAAKNAALERVLETKDLLDAAHTPLDAWSPGGPISQAMQAFLNRRGQP